MQGPACSPSSAAPSSPGSPRVKHVLLTLLYGLLHGEAESRHSSWHGRKDVPSFLTAPWGWQSPAQCHLSAVSSLALFPAQEMTHTCARTCTKMYFSIFKKGKVAERLRRGNARTKASLTQRLRLRAGLGRGTRTRRGAAWAQVSRGEGSCWFRKENDATHGRRQTA